MPTRGLASGVSGNRMKTNLHILTLVFFATLVSCGQPNVKEKNNSVITYSTKTTLSVKTTLDKEERERLEMRKKMEEQTYADSIRLDKVLQDALEIAYKKFSKNKFVEKYIVSPDSFTVSIEIKLDYLFSKEIPHLIIRRMETMENSPLIIRENVASYVYIDVYFKSKNKFEKVLSHSQWTMEYVNDTIRDVNGDGMNDFIVNWYGVNGCCLKAFSNVYLLRQDNKTFSKNFEFINPTFSPKEKIIRGVCYGQPGETEMYKYKWNGEKVDTLEYISYEKNDKGVKTGKILISKDEPYGDKFKILKVLDSVPKEYRKIDGYNWFIGNF